MTKMCEVRDCDRQSYALRMCKPHYYRVRRTGSPEGKTGIPVGGSQTGTKKPRPITLTERFEANVPDRPNDGCCWLYMGTVQRGYGVISAGKGVRFSAHRVAYELWVGPIPDGMDIDHDCHNQAKRSGLCEGGQDCLHRRCVNPEHLVPRTNADNRKLAGLLGRRHDEPE